MGLTAPALAHRCVTEITAENVTSVTKIYSFSPNFVLLVAVLLQSQQIPAKKSPARGRAFLDYPSPLVS
jgi:hypothetical protein